MLFYATKHFECIYFQENLIAVLKFNTWLGFKQLLRFIKTVTTFIPSSDVTFFVVASAVVVTTADVATLVPENRVINKDQCLLLPWPKPWIALRH